MAPAAAKGAQCVRQRRAHSKSRLGCGNCKLRSVKCDELRPSCKRCLHSGVTCSYSRQGAGFQPYQTAAFRLDLNPGLSPPRRIPVALPVSTRLGEYELQPLHLAALDRFRNRNLQDFGSRHTEYLFSDRGSGLAVSHPFLLHYFILMDLIHASVLSTKPLDTTREGFLAFHWYQGTVLLRQMLIRDPSTCTGSDCDALWSAAALLGTASFAYVEGNDPTEVWPLKISDASDLSWLRMGDGKMAVSAAFDSLEIDSLFAKIKKEAQTSPLLNTPTDITPGVFPPSFYTVFGLESYSREESNPYYRVAALLCQTCEVELDAGKMNILFVITHQMDERFKRLLHGKDHRAMLLLAWCYVKSASSSQWWMRKRSFLEGLAICQYLERECHANPLVIELLETPRTAFVKCMKEDRARYHGVV